MNLRYIVYTYISKKLKTKSWRVSLTRNLLCEPFKHFKWKLDDAHCVHFDRKCEFLGWLSHTCSGEQYCKAFLMARLMKGIMPLSQLSTSQLEENYLAASSLYHVMLNDEMPSPLLARVACWAPSVSFGSPIW